MSGRSAEPGRKEATPANEAEYSAMRRAREDAISENRSRRLRNPPEPPVLVPPKPEPLYARFAYTAEGTYEGRIMNGDEPLDPSWIIKWEKVAG